jgi:hypothetical protein
MIAALERQIEEGQVATNAQEAERCRLEAELSSKSRELQSEQRRMDRLRKEIPGKLILPFGKSQQKLSRLITRPAPE